jgi:hypothetical protein
MTNSFGITIPWSGENKAYAYDFRSNSAPLVVILKDGTKIRYGE